MGRTRLTPLHEFGPAHAPGAGPDSEGPEGPRPPRRLAALPGEGPLKETCHSRRSRPSPLPRRPDGPAHAPWPPLQGRAKFLTCSLRSGRESVRAEAASLPRNREREAGRASAEKPPPSSCRHRDPDAARPVRRPLRPLAGCVRACGVVALSASELANGPLRRDRRLLPSPPAPAIHRAASLHWPALRHSAGRWPIRAREAK